MKHAHRTARPHPATALDDVVEQNIVSLLEVRQKAERVKSVQEHVADLITAFSGSMFFVYLHVIWFGAWILWNSGYLGATPFDPYPFGMLTTIVSLEAIFLSTFVLISQNRQAKVADRREELDLQVNLLAEHEITRLLRLTDAIARKVGVTNQDAAEMADLKRDVAASEMLEKLDAAENGNDPSHCPKPR
jgi:uncharacterized membrane protein